jgi:hypothetical protein
VVHERVRARRHLQQLHVLLGGGWLNANPDKSVYFPAEWEAEGINKFAFAGMCAIPPGTEYLLDLEYSLIAVTK